jgi:hypothetical protein
MPSSAMSGADRLGRMRSHTLTDRHATPRHATPRHATPFGIVNERRYYPKDDDIPSLKAAHSKIAEIVASWLPSAASLPSQ